jgi:hypothetical protein
MTGSVRRSRDPGLPWLAILPDGQEIACESLAMARHVAQCPLIGIPPDPVPLMWLRDFLAFHGLSAPDLVPLLRMPNDRSVRRWKAGEPTPWAVAALLAAWADGRAPDLDAR